MRKKSEKERGGVIREDSERVIKGIHTGVEEGEASTAKFLL